MANAMLLVIAISLGLVSAGGLDVPHYISKCALSDPEFQTCIRVKANEVIPILAKGDAVFGIRPMSPLIHAKAEVKAKDLTIIMTDATQEGIENMKTIDVLFDLKNQKCSFMAVVDKLVTTAKSYTIKDGKILDIPVQGHGRFNLTLEDVMVVYKVDLRPYEKDDDTFVKFTKPLVNTTARAAHFYFENIQSPKIKDVNAYIEKNVDKFMDQQFKKVVNMYMNIFLGYPINSIASKVPLSQMFLP